MKLNDAIDMKGRLTLRLHDKSGNLIEERAADNDIVLTGRDLVAKLFAKIADVKPISHIAVGTGTTPVDPANDKALGAELARKAIKPVDATKDIAAVGDKMRVIVSAELGLDDAIGALTEAAIFNSETPVGSVMYNRVVFPTVNKTKDFKLTLVWEILF